MTKTTFPYLVLLCAISVSLSAAYYSVYGLSKLFSGAANQVIIMASTLEASKLIIAASLHNYWTNLSILLKLYLTVALIILIIITSAGIYGYLSSAYQVTHAKDYESEMHISLLESSKTGIAQQLSDFSTDLKTTQDQITQLRSSLGNNVQQSVDRKTGLVITSTSITNTRSYERQLTEAVNHRDWLLTKTSLLRDTIGKIDINIVKLKNDASHSTELGPLKYISKITGKSMDIVVNWFLLMLIIVFDPLAIVLMILSIHMLRIFGDTMPRSELHVPIKKESFIYEPEIHSSSSQDSLEQLKYIPNDIVTEPVAEPVIENKIEPLDVIHNEIPTQNNTPVEQNKSTIIETGLPPEITNNIMDKIYSNVVIDKTPELSESQKKIMSHQEINEFYKKFQ